MHLELIKKQVASFSEKKTDITTTLRALTPNVSGSTISLCTRNRERTMPLTKRGQMSYLQMINVPKVFFSSCSQDLRQNILREFHARQSERNVLLRLVGEEIRFIGSSRYRTFNDTEVINSLEGIDEKLTIKDFHQDHDFLKLRATTEDAIIPSDGKVFYPGVQVINSETGLSSVRVDFFIYEQVCTNGMVVPYADLPALKMKHTGKPLGTILSDSFSEAVQHLPVLKKRAQILLEKAENLSSVQVHNILKNIKNEGKAIPLKKIEEMARKYQAGSDMKALDLLSGYTEIAKNFNVEDRLAHETIAGTILKNIAS
jgi:hypothetical protein